MKIAFLLILLTGLAAPAMAQDIRWKPETITPGDYIRIDQTMGGLIHHVYRGKKGRSYILESYRGPSPKGKPVFVTYVDKDGNYLRWVRADGFEIKYKPHDCTRTLGRCQYTESHSDGTRKVRLRITKATKRGFKFDEYGADGKRLFGGTIELDEKGNGGNGRISGDQGRQKFRVVKRVYQ